jgi:hypothetical protein
VPKKVASEVCLVLHCQGVETYLDIEKKHSFEHNFFPAIQLSPLHVGCLVGCCVGCCVVAMLLSLSLFTFSPHCQHPHCRHCQHAAPSATTFSLHRGWRLLHECQQQPHHVVAHRLPGPNQRLVAGKGERWARPWARLWQRGGTLSNCSGGWIVGI